MRDPLELGSGNAEGGKQITDYRGRTAGDRRQISDIGNSMGDTDYVGNMRYRILDLTLGYRLALYPETVPCHVLTPPIFSTSYLLYSVFQRIFFIYNIIR